MINSKLLKIAAISSILFTSSAAMAENLIGLSYIPVAKGKKLSSYQFDDTNILKLDLFTINRKEGGWGYYFSTGTSMDDGGIYYGYNLLNIGATKSLGDRAFVFAGGGYSWESAELTAAGYVYRSEENNDGFNASIGVGYSFGRLGVTASYESAPQGFGTGLTYSF